MPYLEISSQNFFHNHRIILNAITPKAPEKLAIVLKDNAYGHGLKEIAQLAHRVKIQNAFVKNVSEALAIAEFFKSITILYPHSKDSNFKEALLAPNLYFCAPSLESLVQLPPNTKIELKVNSGMNRNGIDKNALSEAFTLITKNNLQLKGIFTHNGFGDDLDSAFYTQNIEFLEIKKDSLALCNHHNLPRPRFHSLSSSGAFRTDCASIPSDLQDDLYRIGIAFYGYLCCDFQSPPLKPIASLYAEKISTLSLKSGASIGYSGVSTLEKDSIVSTYDIGYGDGLFRIREGMELYSAEGFRILPRASMDCISIATDAQKVCIFNNANTFARAFHTIPYEILVHLHSYIPRIVV